MRNYRDLPKRPPLSENDVSWFRAVGGKRIGLLVGNISEISADPTTMPHIGPANYRNTAFNVIFGYEIRAEWSTDKSVLGR